MPEKFPSFEEPKEISEQELIEALQTKGAESPEAQQLLQKWTEQEEKKVENNPLAAIEFNRKRARVYLAAGFKEEALDALEGARMQAWNEQRTELFNEIMAEMDKIEEKD